MDEAIDYAFAEWLPDLPVLKNPGATTATNVIPGPLGYKPFRGLLSASDALDAYPRGAFAGSDKDKNVEIYAGDGTKLYKLSAGTWSNVSKGGNYTLATNETWEFVQFGQRILASSISAPLQGITFGGLNFADELTSTEKPQARHIGVVRDFVVLGNTFDATDGNVPEQVWWLARNSTVDADPAQATLADKQILPNGGAVQKVVGGEYGVIFKERSIYRMSFEGVPLIFRFDEVERQRGALMPGGVVALGRLIFYWGTDGFFAFDGQKSVPIGENKVDLTIADDLDRDFLHRVTSGICTRTGCIWWLYPGVGNIDGRPNRIAVFNWKTRKWSLVEVQAEQLFGALSQGFTLEQLDSISSSLDALPASLDGPEWIGGEYAIAAFDESHMLAFFGGDFLTAVLETAEGQPFAPYRSFVNEVRPLVDGVGSSCTVQMGSRDLQSEAVTWGPVVAANDIGTHDLESDARFHRVRVNIANGFDDAQGAQIFAQRSGIA